MQHRVLSWQTDTHIFLCLSIFSCQFKSEINILISQCLAPIPEYEYLSHPDTMMEADLERVRSSSSAELHMEWSVLCRSYPDCWDLSGKTSLFFIHVYWRLWEILSELLNRWWLKVWIFSRVLIIEITLRQSWQSMFAYQLSQLKPFKRTWGVIWDHERKL